MLQYGYKGELTGEIAGFMKDNLYISLGHLSGLYEQLAVKKNKNILDNIIYLGMRAKCDAIINRCKDRKEKKV